MVLRLRGRYPWTLKNYETPGRRFHFLGCMYPHLPYYKVTTNFKKHLIHLKITLLNLLYVNMKNVLREEQYRFCKSL